MKQAGLKLAAFALVGALAIGGAGARPAHAANTITLGPPPVSQASAPTSAAISIGDFDITLANARYTSTTAYNMFNDANWAVDATIRNARGTSTETINEFLDFTLVDGNGAAHSPDYGCAGCPNPFGSYGDMRLTPGGFASGTIYFQVLPGTTVQSVVFQHFLTPGTATWHISP